MWRGKGWSGGDRKLTGAKWACVYCLALLFWVKYTCTSLQVRSSAYYLSWKVCRMRWGKKAVWCVHREIYVKRCHYLWSIETGMISGSRQRERALLGWGFVHLFCNCLNYLKKGLLEKDKFFCESDFFHSSYEFDWSVILGEYWDFVNGLVCDFSTEICSK